MNARHVFDAAMKHSFDHAGLARWTGGRWLGGAAGTIRGFSIDTRTLRTGDLFIALRGERTDGHAHAAAAIAAGASAVMVERTDELRDTHIPHLLVPDTRSALMALGHGYRQLLRGRFVAITGSVGKTTVKELLAGMMAHVGVTARTIANWNNNIGLPLSLLAAPPDTQFGVFEVGMNHPGELDPLCDILLPDVSVVTCVGPVHIENFENEQGIAHEKASVYRGLRGGGIAVVNIDGAHLDILRSYIQGSRVVEVSARSGADYTLRRTDPVRGLFELHERATGETIEMVATLPGEYFVFNVLLAAATARALGAPWPAIRSAVETYHPLAMRWDRTNVSGVHIINDAYNANPVSLRAAVQAFMEEPVRGKRWVVLAGMLELGVDEERFHREAGAFVAGMDGLRLITVGARGKVIAGGAAAAGMPRDRIHAVADHEAAACVLDEALMTGDGVLFKASRGEELEKVLHMWKTRRGAHQQA